MKDFTIVLIPSFVDVHTQQESKLLRSPAVIGPCAYRIPGHRFRVGLVIVFQRSAGWGVHLALPDGLEVEKAYRITDVKGDYFDAEETGRNYEGEFRHD